MVKCELTKKDADEFWAEVKREGQAERKWKGGKETGEYSFWWDTLCNHKMEYDPDYEYMTGMWLQSARAWREDQGGWKTPKAVDEDLNGGS